MRTRTIMALLAALAPAARSAKTIALLVQRGERRLFVPLQVG